MSCGGDAESEHGNYKCRQGHVKRCAQEILATVQTGHKSRRYSQTGDIGPCLAGKLR